ncbi:MAG TPA: LysR family transcriptional regulator [Polyangiaceae bacterium]|nr:LysR family transcriptional regulator [Polyangiaceae bacterium]
MDLNLVTAFVRVVEQQSFTSAAKALGLPKSSVSRRVTELEEELGVQLLHRTTRKLALTEAGRSYYEQAEKALTELQAAAESATGMDTEARGIVRVTAPFDIGVMGLADIVAEFVREYPEIHVDLSLTSKVVDLVAEGFDLAIRAGHSRDASLVVRRVGTAALGLYASPAYLKAHGRPRALADLGEHDCVLFRGKHGKALWRLHTDDGEPASIEVRGRVNVDEMLFVRQAVGAGLGIGLLPTIVIATCARVGALEPIERVLPEFSMGGADVAVATPSGPKRPRRVTILRDFLVERLAPRCEKHGSVIEA